MRELSTLVKAAVVGLLLTSTLYLLNESILIPVTAARLGYISFVIIVSTFLLLKLCNKNDVINNFIDMP